MLVRARGGAGGGRGWAVMGAGEGISRVAARERHAALRPRAPPPGGHNGWPPAHRATAPPTPLPPPRAAQVPHFALPPQPFRPGAWKLQDGLPIEQALHTTLSDMLQTINRAVDTLPDLTPKG